MKKIVLLLSVLALSLTLGGCQSSEKSDFDPVAVYGCDTINVYNWGEYIGEDVIYNFEKDFNAKVNYSLFDSNEIMYTKLIGGNQYDVLVPSDYMIERLIAENALQPLDQTILTNLNVLDERVISLRDAYDDGGVYSVPYFWGSVGLLYNKNIVSEEEIDELGWDILKDTKYAGQIFMYDSERDSFMVALKALGYSMNTENEDEINEAYEWLMAVQQTMDPAYVTDEVNDAMINEEKAIAVVYSGAAAYIMSENENMAFAMPKQGTNVWSDAMVIPADAKCPGLANEFINYMISYDSAMDSSVTVGYTSSNKQVLEELTAEDGYYANNGAYLPDISNPKNEVFKHNEVLKKKLSELWIKVKVS